MRFSAVAALCAAPLALASILEAQVMQRGGLSRRTMKDSKGDEYKGDEYKGDEYKGSEYKDDNNNKGNDYKDNDYKGNDYDNSYRDDSYKNNYGSATTVIIIWVNHGGSGTPTETINPTGVAPGATHTVTVGGPGGLVYSPDQLHVPVGDMVVFEFYSANHTLTQSPFDTPCKKMEGGMDSGFMANPNNTIVPAPQMAMQVTTDKPLWFYCRQKAHCGKGMVFSINPTAEKSQANFKELAIQQNGTGAIPPIAGGSPLPSADAPAPTNAAPPSGTSPPNGMASGVGTIENGQCSCSCLCGVASFPNPAIQGRGAYGGYAGAMPMAALER